MIKNNRLDALVEKTQGIDTLLDIGCDHGFVILKAFKNNYIKNAIASDINIKPLNMAKKNLNGYPVEFIQTSGFKHIHSEFDGVVIAGMGSNLISSILEDAPKDSDIKYILQGNNKYENLRYYLSNNGYEIIDEELIYDKHYYIIITAKRSVKELSFKEIFLGPILMNKKSSLEYYKHRLNHYLSLDKNIQELNERINIYTNLLSDIIEKLEK